jgi:hypothetical protein
MEFFDCQNFVIENFDPNDHTDLGSLGRVVYCGRDSLGRSVYRFCHNYDNGVWIELYPWQFHALKNVYVIEIGVLDDGTRVHLVAKKSPAIFEWQGQLFQFD